MGKYFGRHDDRWEWPRRCALTSGCTAVLLAASAIIMTACGSDHPTSPSPGSPAPTTSNGGALGDPSLSPGTSSQRPSTASAAGTTAALGPPGNLRIAGRPTTSVLDLQWDPPSGFYRVPGNQYFELSYAGKTLRVGDGTGWREDVSGLDLSPGHAYTFSLRAVHPPDQASAPAQLVFETTPPDPPTNLRQLSTARLPSGEYPDQISFSPGRDNSGVVRRYFVFADGRLVDPFGLPAGTTQFSLYRHVFDSYRGVPCGPTALQLRSEDSSFNVGPLGETLTVFFPEYENCPPPWRDR